MHALAQSGVDGLWFLVADWSVEAVDLRVDRGSSRTLADFTQLPKPHAEIITAIAKFLGIGGSKCDPGELKPVIDVFGDSARIIYNEYQGNKTGLSASVRAGFAIAHKLAISAGHVLAAPAMVKDYHEMVSVSNCRSNAAVSFWRQLTETKLQANEQLARAFKTANEPWQSKIVIRDIESELASIRELAREVMRRP
jgi:hypothetical protein